MTDKSPRKVEVVNSKSTGTLAKVADRQRAAWLRLLELPVLWVVVVVIAGLVSDPRLSMGLVRGPQEVGEVATRDYVATRDLLLLDEESTAARRQEARGEILPVYDRDTALESGLDSSLARLFQAGRGVMEQGSTAAEEARPALEQAASLAVDEPAFAAFSRFDFASELEDRMRGLVAEVFADGLVANKQTLLEHRSTGVMLRETVGNSEFHVVDLFDVREYPDEVREFALGRMRSWPGVGPQSRAVLSTWLVRNLSPNWLPNRAQTLARQQEAAGAVAEAYRQIRTGEVIVRRGDRIDLAAATALAQLSPGGWSLAMGRVLAGRLLLIGLVLALLWTATERLQFPTKSHLRLFGETALLLSIGLVLTRAGLIFADALAMRGSGPPFNSALSYTLAIPFASLALTASLLYRREIGSLLGVIYGLVAGASVPDAGLEITTYAIAGSLAAIFAVEKTPLKHRGTLARFGIIIAAAQIAVVGLIFALAQRTVTLAELGWFVVCALASGLLAAATASFGMPILEPLLGITTDLRLVELSNTNLPLLRRLAFDAPGSFQHSMMVANLAKAGCEEIGADSVLAYTAGLYHDIGKAHRPEYFIENQTGEVNRHDQLSPRMSALILVSHVKDGAKLARQHRLPQPLIDAIEQHHGTRLINFFYRRAVGLNDGKEVAESDFRYPGPRPQSRVMGVLMLADGIEAASRSLQDPTLESLQAVVDRITDDCTSDGQLDDTELTLSDLRKLRGAFFRVLANIHHRRVEYPGFKFDGEPGASTASDRDALRS